MKLAALFALCACTVLGSELRIMPLGDSITYGSHSAATAGYRGPLYTLLTNAGYTNMRYVGTASDTPGTLPAGQQNHEGHSGWVIMNTSASTRQGVYDYLPKSFGQILGPHVILLHIGTNDASVPGNFPDAINRLDQLLDRLSEMQPSAEIIVTSLLTRTDNATYENGIVTHYNPYLPGLVAAHAAKGQKVHFYDMRPKVDPATELDDKLHPNATGYTHMAEGWFEALSAIVPVQADYPEVQPALAQSSFSGTGTTGVVTLRFNVPVSADSVSALAHYTLAPGGTVASAKLSSDGRTVTLQVTGLTEGADYALTVQGLSNVPGTAVLAASDVAFSVAPPPGPVGKVDERDKYQLVYDLDIPEKGATYDTQPVAYAVDNHLKVGAFSRVAYYLELQPNGGKTQYLWVSMDAFTDEAGKIGLPTLASGAVFQQRVSNLKVYTNVAGVPTGARQQGNIEFWPYNYTATRGLKLGKATDGNFDSDDTNSGNGNYGCLQVHDTETGTTLFAYNLWGGRNGSGGAQDLGIGNCPTAGKSDWTRAENSASYSLRHLQVYVMPDVGDTTPPQAVSAVRSLEEGTVTVTFSEPVLSAGLKSAFALTGTGAIETVACDAADPRKVVLKIAGLTRADPLAVKIAGVRDVSPRANLIVPVSLVVPADENATGFPGVPERILAHVPEARDYRLAYEVDLPTRGYKGTATQDRSAEIAAFDRQAYYLELVSASDSSVTNWVWTSFDAVTSDATKLTIPASATADWTFWQKVEHMNVFSNVDGIETGTDIATGNIEFHNKNFGSVNELSIPNADAKTYDFGDSATPSGDHACMQVHNHGAKQVVWAVNKFYRTGSSDYICLGIGNRPGQANIDWTNANNARDFSVRRLFCLARPSSGGTPARVLTPRRAIVAWTRQQVCVSFAEALPQDVAALAASVRVTGASVVSAVRSSAEPRDLIVTLDRPLAAETSGSVSYAWNGTERTVAFTTPSATLPSVLTNAAIDERDAYRLVNLWPIPDTSNASHDGADYRVDESRFNPGLAFDRVAYCLELVNDRTNEWVWVSFAAPEKNVAKIGVPSIERGILTWGYVDDMTVYAGIVEGDMPCQVGSFARGNVEFCASNYGSARSLGLDCASDSLFDMDDLVSDEGRKAGCASLQVHNPLVGETVLSVSSYGNQDLSKREVSVGIGTGPLVNKSTDWTYAKNAKTFKVKNLYVLARPVTAGTRDAFLLQPADGLLVRKPESALTLTAYAVGAVRYQWRVNGEAIPFATNPWLDLDGRTAVPGTYDVVATLEDGAFAVSQTAVIRTTQAETIILVR